MSRAIVANAFRILSLPAGATPREAWARVEAVRQGEEFCLAMPTEGQACEAATRLTDRALRRAEVVFSRGPEGAPWAQAAVRLAELVLRGGNVEAWLDVHREWAALLGDPAFLTSARKLCGGKRATREFLGEIPALLFGAHSFLGAAALAKTDFEGTRVHARAIHASPLGSDSDRARALRVLFAVPASEAAARLAPLEETLEKFGGEIPPTEAKGVDWTGFISQAKAAVAPCLAVVESVLVEAGAPWRDALATLIRNVACLAARSGEPIEVMKLRLEEALAQARSPGLKAELEREVGDPAWAAMVDRALAPLHDGSPARAWKQLKALRKVADTDARRAWIDALMGDPARLVARQRWKPLSFSVLGCGFGYFGHRVVNAEEGSYVASHGLLFLGLPVATRGAYLLRNGPMRSGRKQTLFLGRVPEKFRPSQKRAAALLVLSVLVILALAGVAADFTIGSHDHVLLSSASRALATGNLDEARDLLEKADGNTPISKWRRNRLIERTMCDDIHLATSALALRQVVQHANKLDSPSYEPWQGILQPAYSEPPASAKTDPADWFGSHLDDAVLEALRSIPVPVLSPGGGPAFSEEREVFDEDAAALGEFVDWACRRSPKLSARRHAVAVEAARRFNSPYLWALAVKYALAESQAPGTEELDALKGFLRDCRYARWSDHFFIYDAAVGERNSAAILDNRLRDVWTGVELGYQWKSLKNRLPPDLVALQAVEQGEDDRQTLLSLDEIKVPKLARGAEAEAYAKGWRRKRARALFGLAGNSLDLVLFRRGLDAMKASVAELPNDEDTMDLICLAALTIGYNDEVADFAGSHKFRSRNSYLGRARYKSGRPEEAVEILEPFARERLPGFRRLVEGWAGAVREAREYWIKEWHGELPPTEKRDFMKRKDHLPDSSTPAEWAARMAERDGKASKWRLRCMLAAPDADGIRALARAHAAMALKGGDGAKAHLARAIEIFDETRHWREPAPESDDQLLRSLEALRDSASYEAVLASVAKEADGPIAAALAEVAERAGLRDQAFALYAAAWERTTSPLERRLAANGCARLERDPAKQVEWWLRADPGGMVGKRLREAVEFKKCVVEGRFEGLGPKARNAAVFMLGTGDSPVIHAAAASMFFIAWVSDGETDDLERAAEILTTHPGESTNDVTGSKLAARILLSRANVELSGEALRAEILHEAAMDTWIGYATPEKSRDTIATAARDSKDMKAALNAAVALTTLAPADMEGWELQVVCMRTCGDADALDHLRLVAEIPKEPRPPVFDPFVALRGLSPVEAENLLQGNLARLMDSAVTEANSARHGPTLARALTRRAQVTEILLLRGIEPERLDSIVKDAEDAVAAMDAPEPRSVLMRLRTRRAALALTKDIPALREAIFTKRALDPIVYLAAWARLHPGEAAAWRDNRDLQRVARLAEKQLDSRSFWIDVDTASALELCGSPRASEAAGRLKSERVEEKIARLRHSLYANSEDFTVTAWLAMGYVGAKGDADELAGKARDEQILEGVIWR